MHLIDRYQCYPLLWDPTDPEYKNRVKKLDAWKDISDALHVDRADATKKIDILTSQLRREARKMKCKSGQGPQEDTYTSKWFAFKSLSSFLLDKNNKPQKKTFGVGIGVS